MLLILHNSLFQSKLHGKTLHGTSLTVYESKWKATETGVTKPLLEARDCFYMRGFSKRGNYQEAIPVDKLPLTEPAKIAASMQLFID